jgi:putative Mn2+ efflux pump MntP
MQDKQKSPMMDDEKRKCLKILLFVAIAMSLDNLIDSMNFIYIVRIILYCVTGCLTWVLVNYLDRNYFDKIEAHDNKNK